MAENKEEGKGDASSLWAVEEYLRLSASERLEFVAKLQRGAMALEAKLSSLRDNDRLPVRPQQDSAQLFNAELQLQKVVANVVDYAIFMLDPGGHVLTWNAGAERIKGYVAEEIIGRSFRCFYTEGDRAAGVPEHVLASAKKFGHFEMESWRVRKDGSRFWANVHLSAVRDEKGSLTGFIKITRDMTERRNFEEQLRQSQKMEAIGQLTGGVAHDFNNLLTVILGNLESVLRSEALDAQFRRPLEQAQKGAERGAVLTRQLLAFSRRQPLNPRILNVEQLVVGMGEMLQRTLGESVKVKTSLSGRWRCEADSHQLESAILNLALNARDAMPDGGTLTLDVSNLEVDRKMVGDSFASGDFVVISVSDTGCGMSREVKDRALEPFFTTKPVGQGTGLGLSQVYGFVKQSGGHVDVYSEPDHGTTIRIYLPRSQGEEASKRLPTRQFDSKGGDETILLVEDEEGVRTYCAEILREFGYDVVEAASASSALQQLEGDSQVDLLLTDLGLPGVDGSELARRVQSLRPNLPVLFISGYAASAILQRGRISSDAQLLEKPFARAALARRVRETLDAARGGWKRPSERPRDQKG